VWEAFVANFEEGEVGAACCVTVDGRVVVDIWGGWADTDHQREWTHDTMLNAFSVGRSRTTPARRRRLVRPGSVE
jgi:hypothetical protein